MKGVIGVVKVFGLVVLGRYYSFGCEGKRCVIGVCWELE